MDEIKRQRNRATFDEVAKQIKRIQDANAGLRELVPPDELNPASAFPPELRPSIETELAFILFAIGRVLYAGGTWDQIEEFVRQTREVFGAMLDDTDPA